MSALSRSEVVKNIRNLPALPVIVMQLISTMDQEDANTTQLANTLSRDQALVAKTLRLANSSFYGMQSKITTIQQAITVLGFNSVRTLVTSTAVIAIFSSCNNFSFNVAAFWRHSIATAVCARILARHLKLNQEHAFMVGLLHDIGRLVLVTGSPEHYADVLADRQQRDCYLLEAERTVLGIDHSQVGETLAEHWKFPMLMRNAIANHHVPNPGEPESLTTVVHVADCIVHALDLSDDEDDLVMPVSEVLWRKLNLQQDVLEQIYRETESRFEDASRILSSMTVQ